MKTFDDLDPMARTRVIMRYGELWAHNTNCRAQKQCYCKFRNFPRQQTLHEMLTLGRYMAGGWKVAS